jgi:ribosomal protein S18 acetylase RimI-like enzyme
MMDITIRKVNIADYEKILPLMDSINKLHRQEHPEIFQEPIENNNDNDYLREQILDENVGFFVAESAGDILGYIHASVRETPPISILVPRRYATIESLVVRQDVHRCGIGRLLMNAIRKWAKSIEVTNIDLNVYDFNQAALLFYENLGYKTYSRRMKKSI